MSINKLKQNKALRQLQIDKIEDISTLAHAAVDDQSLHTRFKLRYEDLDDIYQKYQDHHSAVISILATTENPTFEVEKAINAVCVDNFFTIKTIYARMFPESKSIPDGVQSSKSFNVKLPKISLPTFDGNYRSWPTFYDMFTSLIHNNTDLSEIEKFQYLLSSLSSQALSVLKGFPLTSQNYQIAFDTLTTRYQNKRLLANACWQEIVNAPKMHNESASVLRRLLEVFSENLSALKLLNLPTDQWDFVLFHILIQKLDTSMIRRFELHECSTKIPSFSNLKEFLDNQCIALESVSFSTSQKNTSTYAPTHPSTSSHNKRSSTFLSQTEVNSSAKLSCNFCKSNHSIYKCPSFLSKSPSERFRIVKTQNWCFNCLHSGHVLSSCSSKSLCRSCNGKHHSLIHLSSENTPSVEPPSTLNVVQFPSGSTQVLTNIQSPRSSVLLATAQVEIQDVDGNYQYIRILLDAGSQVNIITQNCVRRLGLRTSNEVYSLLGVGGNLSSANKRVVCTIRPINKANPLFTFDAIVLPKICSNMPNSLISPKNHWNFISKLKLADPKFNIPGPIDLLLGAEMFPLILKEGVFQGNSLEPSAIQTVFGWILMGRINSSPNVMVNSFHVTLDSPLESQLKKFWELEEIPHTQSLSADDQLCEQRFVENVSRDPSGRYMVALPFKNGSPPTFGDTYSMALRRFKLLERRLMTSDTLYKDYCEFMKDYEVSGHMSLVTSDNMNQNSYYIPHHCVMKPESTSTKLRVVFDASAKASNNISLNDSLLIGQRLQKDIVALLLRFRSHKFVFTADVRQMYRQILMKPTHRHFQRILWRFTPSEDLKVYQLNTVTYGVSSAPYLAQRTLQQLAQDEHQYFPDASKVLTSDVYVDDIISGAEDISEALKIQKQLISLLQKGGFELRKWCSNCSELLESIPEDYKHQSYLEFDTDSSLKILGLKWLPSQDCFSYSVEMNVKPCTKRAILSDIARIFDPLGFLSPFTFLVKYLLQYLWTLGLHWDDQVPDNVESKWNLCKSELSYLSRIKIARHVFLKPCNRIELHGFADSSERGYSAVIYLRVINTDKSVKTSLICAKSKVAPLKRVSLPRLELCGALLLSRLISFVSNTYQEFVKFDKIYAWSDSTIALAWIKSSPHRWKTFVSNRTAQIQELVSPELWFHVRSEENPADCATRGLTPSELKNCSLWWAGPTWLQTNEEISISKSEIDENHDSIVLAEERQIVLTAFVSHEVVDEIIENHSSFSKIKFILANVLRFIYNLRHPNSRRIGAFSGAEIRVAFFHLIKNVQYSVFREDIENIRRKKPLIRHLRKLNPFIDDAGILRVGGRLSYSGLSYDHKHPALLPCKHRLTDLIIEFFHKTYLHPGTQTLQFLLSQQVWILSARRAIHRVVSRCHICFKTNPKPIQPLMGNLPSARVTSVKPFQCVGVDFGGPFLTTPSKSRGIKSHKSYVCLFVCFTTKALHLELVSDLSSPAFLAALRRFISRRGRCNKIYSDCGTNFKGAYRELLQLMQNATEEERIEWNFNPPSAPHFGGLWESGIKSVKSHLIKLIGDQILTFEEFYTVLVQIESVLNSRPLCPLSSDPNDISALTPGHFLTLAPLTPLPEPDFSSVPLGRLSRWQLLTRLHRDFWKRWHKQYLNTLQQRQKWYSDNTCKLSPGMLVLIKDEQLPPLRWKLGRIIELHLGKDSRVRVCTLRTSNGILQRPVVKLCPLPQ